MIKVYSKENCPFCVKAKEYLKRHGYSFEEVRIDLDDAARDYLMEEGHRSVPQLYVNDTVLCEGGYTALASMTTKQIATRIREINGN